MEIVKTYILVSRSTNAHFDDEYYKVHKLKDGYFIKEDYKGRLSPISKVDFDYALSRTHLFV